MDIGNVSFSRQVERLTVAGGVAEVVRSWRRSVHQRWYRYMIRCVIPESWGDRQSLLHAPDGSAVESVHSWRQSLLQDEGVWQQITTPPPLLRAVPSSAHDARQWPDRGAGQASSSPRGKPPLPRIISGERGLTVRSPNAPRQPGRHPTLLT